MDSKAALQARSHGQYLMENSLVSCIEAEFNLSPRGDLWISPIVSPIYTICMLMGSHSVNKLDQKKKQRMILLGKGPGVAS